MVKFLLPGALALLVAVQVVRLALVDALAAGSPATAARLWSTHPDVRLGSGMTEIATAARDGRPVAPAVFETIYAAGKADLLAVEPFLVRGIQAQLAGDSRTAEQAFVQARWRDGRSLPARYFLAEHYLRRRDAARGLREIGTLARLVPDGTSKLAPYVARYAADPANRDQLRRLFRSEPSLEETSLAVLATDARNAALVLSLSTPERRNGESAWLPLLLDSLIKDRQYARARQIWANLSGVRVDPSMLLFDPQFARAEPPPPFNWELLSSAVGLAERQRGGGLHLIYHGQEEGTLARQMLVLAPGTYRLTAKAAGASQAEALRWTIICSVTNEPIASGPLTASMRAGWRFSVPASCPAQRLELGGTVGDTPQQADITVQSLSLTAETRGG